MTESNLVCRSILYVTKEMDHLKRKLAIYQGKCPESSRDG